MSLQNAVNATLWNLNQGAMYGYGQGIGYLDYTMPGTMPIPWQPSYMAPNYRYGYPIPNQQRDMLGLGVVLIGGVIVLMLAMGGRK
jgi:hypothetical protein